MKDPQETGRHIGSLDAFLYRDVMGALSLNVRPIYAVTFALSVNLKYAFFYPSMCASVANHN